MRRVWPGLRTAGGAVAEAEEGWAAGAEGWAGVVAAGGYVGVLVLLGLGAELAAVGQPHGVARVQEVDVLVGYGVVALHLVSLRDGVDGLPFLHDVDIVAAAVDDLGLIAYLDRRGARSLGLCGIEN